MKRLATLFCMVCTCLHLLAFDIPKPINYVNDYANVLSQAEEDTLNQKLKVYQDSTSTQIAVLTILAFDDTKEGPLFDYSLAVFNQWKIGQKDKNNGVLLVVVQHLTSKNAPGLRIVTGYGAEGPLPDISCKRIIEKIRPFINKGNNYEGISIAINSMISIFSVEFKAEESKALGVWFWVFVFAIILIIVVLLLIIANRNQGGSSSSSSYFFSSSSDSSSSSGESFFSGFDGGSSGGGGAGD